MSETDPETADGGADEPTAASEPAASADGASEAAAAPEGADAPASAGDDEAGAEPPAESAPAAGGKRKVKPDEIKLERPPEGAEIPPIEPVNMRDGPGMPAPVVLAAEGPEGGLTFPPGDLQAAEEHLGRGDTDAARKIGAALTDDESTAIAGRTLTIRAHLMDGNLDAARAVMGRARDEDAMALADAALSLGEGDAARARKRVAEALEKNPEGLAEHYTLALIEVAEGRIAEAMTTLHRVAASAPAHAVARHQLGQLTLAAGDPARAGTLFEMAVELAPTFAPPALALAEMLIDSRQYAEAMSVLGGVTERLPNALAPRLLQLRILVEVGEKQAAESLADALFAAAPDHVDVVAMWAEARLLAGRGEEARADLERLVSQAGGDGKARLLRLLARCDLAAIPQRGDDAIAHLEEAIGVAAAPGEMRLELVQLFLGMGSHDRAVAVLDEMQRDGRTDLGELLSGAVVARNHGLWAAARRLAETAVSQVKGTPAEGQVAGFLASLPETE